MIPVYSDLLLQPGEVEHGIVRLAIAPIEWMQAPLSIDFATGIVSQPVALSNSWISLFCVPNTYDYDEKAKTGKSGDAYEITITGKLNNVGPDERSLIETYRHHQFIVQGMDKKRRLRLIGNQDYGMRFTYGNKITGGVQDAAVTLYFDTEDTPPFYVV